MQLNPWHGELFDWLANLKGFHELQNVVHVDLPKQNFGLLRPWQLIYMFSFL